jgi:hypothetical protein
MGIRLLVLTDRQLINRHNNRYRSLHSNNNHNHGLERHQNCWADTAKRPDQKILIWTVFIHHREGLERNTTMMGMVQ